MSLVLRGPGWRPTRFDNCDAVTPEESGGEYCTSQDPIYNVWVHDWMEGLTVLDAGIGPHGVPILEAVLDLVKPKTILEIGFASGGSASMFMRLDPAVRVTSVDVRPWPIVAPNVTLIRQRFPDRFAFFNMDSRTLLAAVGPGGLRHGSFDLVFIDGNHEYEFVLSDLRFAAVMEPKFVLLDDWWPIYGPGVQPAVKRCGFLKPAGAWGNMRLFAVEQ